MTDICYILGKGSKWENNEIRYSLRSINKHLSNYRNIYIIGEFPSFIKNVIHIPMNDTQISKETNIYAKVLRACQEESISDDFLFFNDDHFLNSNFDADTFPNFYKIDLVSTISRVRNFYKKPLISTERVLRERGLGVLNFDTHTPIRYNKEKFISVMSGYDWTIRHGYVVKSLYGNSLNLSGEEIGDSKIGRDYGYDRFVDILRKAKIWSIGDKALGANLTRLLNELYPVKSKWES